MLFIWFKIVSLFVLFSSKMIIFDENKTNKLTILNHINNIDKHLQFKISRRK